ncbi:M23 family metallopeptidase [Candidatus Halobeggiatoa sp. HSG11]|nr:M23 family metallopeptidase [Candidatus Halobeggiatoa sp. HSG11]
MNKTIFFLVIILFPLIGKANYIEKVLFTESVINIQHRSCYLKRTIEEKNTLILVLGNCKTKNGQITPLHPNIVNIHWAQHDKRTVWLVVKFLNKYNFEISLSKHQYNICLPVCKQSNGLLKINGILLQVPVQNMTVNDFLDNSIGFLPKDLVKDGLPHFGAKRDDWNGKIRKHRGYDVYVNNINIVAAAYGKVTKVRKTKRAGLYIKIHHEGQLDTLYIHLKKAFVTEGQIVNAGYVIGKVDGPVGNAIAPQLHFEIKLNKTSVDPLVFIEKFYRWNRNIINKIRKYKSLLTTNIKSRNRKVKIFLKSK